MKMYARQGMSRYTLTVQAVREHARAYIGLQKKRNIILSDMTLIDNTLTQVGQVSVTDKIGTAVNMVSEAMLDLPALADLEATQQRITAFSNNMVRISQLKATTKDMLEPDEVEPDDCDAVEDLVKSALGDAGRQLAAQV